MDIYVALYSRDHVQRAIPQYFEQPSKWSRHPSRILIGHPRVDHATESTKFIVRVAHRHTPKVTRCQQGRDGRVSRRRYYITSSYSYVVASVSWRDASVRELIELPTKRDAIAYFAK